MTLDIFPKARAPKAAPVEETASELPEPAAEAVEEVEKRRSRRGTRGGRAKKAEGETAEATATEAPDTEAAAAEAAVTEAATGAPVEAATTTTRARRPRRTKATIAAEAAAAEAAAAEAAAAEAAAAEAAAAAAAGVDETPVDEASAAEAAEAAAAIIAPEGHEAETPAEVEAEADAEVVVAAEAEVEAEAGSEAAAEVVSDEDGSDDTTEDVASDSEPAEEPVVAYDEATAAIAAEEDAEHVAHGEPEAFVIEGDEAEGGEIQREPRRRDRRGSRGGRGRGGDRNRGADEAQAEGGATETEARQQREPRERQGQGQPREVSLDSLARAIEQQSRQIDQIVRSSANAGAPPPRVGIFVDTANIELAADRQRVRLDWSKVLSLLTRDRQLVRAIAYSPVHDDPTVSVETQRFVEPFLDRGFKIVTKPLKRFQDGSIKANVDIELALDVVTMCDRLDIVCLVSGDGDFEKLVELVQGKGIRVEVVSFGSSTAGNLKNAADAFIDFQSRLREVRL